MIWFCTHCSTALSKPLMKQIRESDRQALRAKNTSEVAGTSVAGVCRSKRRDKARGLWSEESRQAEAQRGLRGEEERQAETKQTEKHWRQKVTASIIGKKRVQHAENGQYS